MNAHLPLRERSAAARRARSGRPPARPGHRPGARVARPHHRRARAQGRWSASRSALPSVGRSGRRPCRRECRNAAAPGRRVRRDRGRDRGVTAEGHLRPGAEVPDPVLPRPVRLLPGRVWLGHRRGDAGRARLGQPRGRRCGGRGPKGDRALDVGCGPGARAGRPRRGEAVTGVDPCAADAPAEPFFVRQAVRAGHCFLQGTAGALPVPDQAVTDAWRSAQPITGPTSRRPAWAGPTAAPRVIPVRWISHDTAPYSASPA